MEVKRALISVSDKTGLDSFSRALHSLGAEIIATGSTAQFVKKLPVPVKTAEEVTGFPEMLGGRVKTLHPAIHAAILARKEDEKELAEHGIRKIDLVCVNLYPFEEIVSNPKARREDAIENIDIGGVALLRAAAKNHENTVVVSDPSQYEGIAGEMRKGKISLETRSMLASRAFQTVAYYDSLIAGYFSSKIHKEPFPKHIAMPLKKFCDCRYGENPHQAASVYRLPWNAGTDMTAAEQLWGKQMSANNFADSSAAVSVILEFGSPAASVIKHTNPSGVAVSDSIFEAFKKAHECDTMSDFGGIIALNRECDAETAKLINSFYNEIVAAPSYSKDALGELRKSKTRRILKLPLRGFDRGLHAGSILGGMILQEMDVREVKADNIEVVSKKKPSGKQIEDMLFAWKVARHTKSNAVIIAKDSATLGIGSGFTSRIDAVDFACRKAGEKSRGAVMASDGFFPFRDSVDAAARNGIAAIIQPGGSMRDREVIQASDEAGMVMVFTGTRAFLH